MADACLRSGIPYEQLYPKCGYSGLFTRLYASAISAFLAAFGECHVAILDLELIVRAPAHAIDSIGRWLGLLPVSAHASHSIASVATKRRPRHRFVGEGKGTPAVNQSAPNLHLCNILFFNFIILNTRLKELRNLTSPSEA